MLAIAIILLSPAYLGSCATSRPTNVESEKHPQPDSADVFVPTHPPIVVPHSWHESGKQNPTDIDKRCGGAKQI